MFAHCNSAKRPRVVLRAARFSTAWINGPVLALACGLLAGCAAPGAGPIALADDPNAPPKIDPAVKQTAGAGLETKVVATDPISLQRRRQAIADLIEGRLAYVARFVEGGGVRLTETQFAGPFEFSYKYPFMDRDRNGLLRFGERPIPVLAVSLCV